MSDFLGILTFCFGSTTRLRGIETARVVMTDKFVVIGLSSKRPDRASGLFS